MSLFDSDREPFTGILRFNTDPEPGAWDFRTRLDQAGQVEIVWSRQPSLFDVEVSA